MGLELPRKFFHLLGFLYVVLYWLVERAYGHEAALQAMFAVLCVMLISEYVRLSTTIRPPVLRWLWGRLRRPKEEARLGAEIHFFVGVFVCFAVFSFDVAMAATLMLTAGDVVVGLLHFFGPRFGKHGVGGVLAAIVVNVCVGVLVVPLWTAVLMGVAAALTETFVNFMDDDLLVPIVAALVGSL